MYILIVEIIASPEAVEPHAETHRNWVKQYLQEGIFLAAGARKDKRGGVILAKAIDQKLLEARIKEDIYVRAGVAKYDIIAIDCKFAAPGYENLIEE